jgi:hypothetical protein
MLQDWTLVCQSGGGQSEGELRDIFGPGAIISRVGHFNLIHLDQPSPEEVARRVREFDPDDLFEDDCPLCQMMKDEGGNVVYDDDF